MVLRFAGARRSVLLLVALLLLGAACSGCSPLATYRASTCASVTGAARAHDGPYRVGRLDFTVVDTSRPTAADPLRHLPAKPSRTLPVMVLYPAAGTPPRDPGTAPTTDATAASKSFPLIVFSHGIGASGPDYEPRLQRWARAGYVVAAPTFPLTGPGAKFPGDPAALADYRNQPADVRFVLTKLLAGVAAPGNPLHGTIDANEIAVAGHSLGAITTLGLVENSCCHDPRIKAGISISGAELPFPNGTFADAPSTPLLLIHGTADLTAPISGSDKAFLTATPPVYELRIDGGTHTSVVAGPDAAYTDEAVIAFLDHELKHQPNTLTHLATILRWGFFPGAWNQR